MHRRGGCNEHHSEALEPHLQLFDALQRHGARGRRVRVHPLPARGFLPEQLPPLGAEEAQTHPAKATQVQHQLCKHSRKLKLKPTALEGNRVCYG